MNDLVYGAELHSLVKCPYKDCKRFLMNTARYAFRTRPFKTRVVHHEVPVPKKETANKKGKKSNNAQPMTLKSLPDPFQQWQQNLDYQAINGYAQQQPVGFMPQPHLQHPGALPPQG